MIFDRGYTTDRLAKQGDFALSLVLIVIAIGLIVLASSSVSSWVKAGVLAWVVLP